MDLKIKTREAPLRARSAVATRAIRAQVSPALEKLGLEGKKSIVIETPEDFEPDQFRGLVQRAVAQDGFSIGTMLDGRLVEIWVTDFDPEAVRGKDEEPEG